MKIFLSIYFILNSILAYSQISTKEVEFLINRKISENFNKASAIVALENPIGMGNPFEKDVKKKSVNNETILYIDSLSLNSKLFLILEKKWVYVLLLLNKKSEYIIYPDIDIKLPYILGTRNERELIRNSEIDKIDKKIKDTIINNKLIQFSDTIKNVYAPDKSFIHSINFEPYLGYIINSIIPIDRIYHKREDWLAVNIGVQFRPGKSYKNMNYFMLSASEILLYKAKRIDNNKKISNFITNLQFGGYMPTILKIITISPIGGISYITNDKSNENDWCLNLGCDIACPINKLILKINATYYWAYNYLPTGGPFILGIIKISKIL
jgi:hypothetical protein